MFHGVRRDGGGMSKKPPNKGGNREPRKTRPAARNPNAVVAPTNGAAEAAAHQDTPPPSPMPDEQPATPARCARCPIPMLLDGTPDWEALADQTREEIETERVTIWREVLKKDRHNVLDHDHLLPPSTPAVWQAERPQSGFIPRPTLHEMHQHMARNQLGDAELLRLRCLQSMTFDHKRKRWLFYDRIRWVDDAVGNSVSTAMEVAEWYDEAATEQFAERDKDVEQAEAKVLDHHSDPESQEAKQAVMEAAKAARKANATKVNALRDRAKAIRALPRTKAILEVAASGSGSLGVSGDTWDTNPTVIACQNGIIQLDTGKLIKASPDMMIRKVSPYPYVGLNEHSPFWDEHLRKVFCGDDALIDYFERVIGYAATGLMSHKELYCAYGPRANNGKSQTFNAIADALGEYAGSFKVSVLLEDGAKGSGPDPDLLILDGLRMAITSEPRRGAKFSSDRLKMVTGDDPITARGLYADNITFSAQCKLFLHTNFIPQLRSADRAFEKRLRVIPFEAVFTMADDEVDPARHVYRALPSDVLKREMESAGPAILSWVVRCARRFLRDRDLTPPPIVQQWTKEYAEEQDLVGEFISMCCDQGEHLKVQAKDLYGAFQKFCRNEKNIPEKMIMSQRSFGDDMKQRFSKHNSRIIWYLGLHPRSEWMPEANQGEYS